MVHPTPAPQRVVDWAARWAPEEPPQAPTQRSSTGHRPFGDQGSSHGQCLDTLPSILFHLYCLYYLIYVREIPPGGTGRCGFLGACFPAPPWGVRGSMRACSGENGVSGLMMGMGQCDTRVVVQNSHGCNYNHASVVSYDFTTLYYNLQRCSLVVSGNGGVRGVDRPKINGSGTI